MQGHVDFLDLCTKTIKSVSDLGHNNSEINIYSTNSNYYRIQCVRVAIFKQVIHLGYKERHSPEYHLPEPVIEGQGAQDSELRNARPLGEGH